MNVRKKKKLSNNQKRKIRQWLAEADQHLNNRAFLEAEALCNQVLQIDPQCADAWNMLGVILLRHEKFDAAASLFRKAIELNKSFAGFHVNLGLALAADQDYAGACRALEDALSLDPDHVEILYQLGKIHVHLHHPALAATYFERVLEKRPKHLTATIDLAAAQQDLGKVEQSMALCEKVLETHPNHTDAHHNLAVSLIQLGRFSEAEAHLREAIRLDPNHASSYYSLARLDVLAPDDKLVARMEGMFTDKKTGEDARIQLGFALGQVYEKAGRYKQAFQYYAEGNRLKRQTLSYSVEDDFKALAWVRQSFTREVMREKIGPENCQDETPIFIVGMPRSGTSLTEQILASHPDVHGAGESDFLLNSLRHYCPKDGNRVMFEAMADFPVSVYAEMGQGYVDCLRKASSETSRFITDKTPTNFLYLGMMHLMLPRARIIHIRRDPMATCLSIYKCNFKGRFHKYAYDLSELGRFYQFYLELMQHWRGVLPEGSMLEIDYEHLVSRPEDEIRRMLSFCDLSWDESCLHFYRNKRAVRTASATQVRKPMYTGSIRYWEHFATELEPLAQQLNIPKATVDAVATTAA